MESDQPNKTPPFASTEETAQPTPTTGPRAPDEEALPENEAQGAADHESMRRLYELHVKLSGETDLKAALRAILATAVAFTGTDRGCVQLVSGDGRRLEMFAHHGYGEGSGFTEYFLHEGSKPACDHARQYGQRLVIEDVATFPPLRETRDREVALAEGIRATQSTPMISRKGELVGVLSTQFREPHRPGDQQLRLIDLLAWTAADFVARHRAEVALRKSQERFRLLVRASTDVVFTMSPDLKQLHYLDGKDFLSDVGTSGSGWLERYIPAEDRPPVQAAIAEAIRTKSIFALEHRVIRADGRVGWIYSRAVPVLGEQGEITEWVGAASDISFRRQAGEERLKNDQVLRQAEEVAHMGSWEYDLPTDEMRWSEGMYRLFGLPQGSPVRVETYLDFVVDEDRPRAEKLISRLRAGKDALDETLRVRVNGQVHTLRIKSYILSSSQGAAVKILGVDLDISELKRLEAENLKIRLEQQQQLLNAILEAQEEERRRISESLHNGVGQLLYATKLHLSQVEMNFNADQTQRVREGLRATEALLTEAIIETRRASHELVTVLLKEYGLGAAIADFCSRFSGKGIAFSCHGIGERLPDHLEMAVYRIAQELVNNIVKHAGATRARIEVSKDKDTLLIEAQDNGKGMNGANPGKGIGLRTIADRVKLLDGKIEVESAPGKGTLVTVLLPLSRKDDPA